MSAAVKNRGWRAYVPVSFFVALSLSIGSFFLIPKTFWDRGNIGNCIMVYAGLLTFSGILLAVGWSSFSKVFEVLGRGNMSRMLKEMDVLDVHFMYVSLTNFILSLFAIICAVGLISLTITKPTIFDQLILSTMTGIGFLAIAATFNMNSFLQGLIWDEIYYE
jgi:hypothetical protein